MTPETLQQHIFLVMQEQSSLLWKWRESDYQATECWEAGRLRSQARDTLMALMARLDRHETTNSRQSIR